MGIEDTFDNIGSWKSRSNDHHFTKTYKSHMRYLPRSTIRITAESKFNTCFDCGI